jgi:DNA-directed RNA polymerase subunit RPC12/RpoP
MVKNKKVYKEFFDIPEDLQIVCEYCGRRTVVDIHHVRSKGMGGSKKLDVIENLIGLCRECHGKAHYSSAVNKEMEVLASDLEARKIKYENNYRRGL